MSSHLACYGEAFRAGRAIDSGEVGAVGGAVVDFACAVAGKGLCAMEAFHPPPAVGFPLVQSPLGQGGERLRAATASVTQSVTGGMTSQPLATQESLPAQFAHVIPIVGVHMLIQPYEVVELRIAEGAAVAIRAKHVRNHPIVYAGEGLIV